MQKTTQYTTKSPRSKIKCDRCKTILKDAFVTNLGSGGCYLLDGYWGKVANRKPWEKVICDACMFKAPGYKKIYG